MSVDRKLPTLPDIPLAMNWTRLRYFLTEFKSKFESLLQNPDPPDQVDNVAVRVANSGVSVTWNNTNRATSYVIYRAVSSNKFKDALAVGWIPRAFLGSFFDTGSHFKNTDTRTYWVQAQNGIVVGPLSTSVTIPEPLISDIIPALHAVTHENGGTDEINVTGLSGLLADPQTPLGHHISHELGGSDVIKLDDLGTPDDTTDLDSTTGHHGLLKKLPGGTTTFLRADGSFAVPPGTGTGDFVGPASSANGDVVVFDGITGKLGKDTSLVAASLVVGPASVTSGHLATFNGTTGKLIQDGGAAPTGTNTGDVTLAGTPNYITIAAQVITRALIDLANHITGRLAYANHVAATVASVLVGRRSGSAGDMEEVTLGTGLTMSSGAVLSCTVTGTGDFSGPASSTDGDVVVFNGATGKLGKDTSLVASSLVVGPASVANGDVAVYDGTTGKLIKDTSLVASSLVVGPASAVSGNLAVYDGTTGKLIKDGGFPVASVGFYPAPTALIAPVSSDFSWRNQGGATINTTVGVFLQAPAASGDNFRIREKAVSGNHTVIAAFIPSIALSLAGAAGGNSGCGIGWNDGTKLVVMNFVASSITTAISSIQVYKYTNVTTGSAQYTALNWLPGVGGMIWMKIQDNGTNRICSVSNDSVNWIQVHSVGRTDFLTPSNIMYFANANNSAWPASMTLLHWTQTSP